ncbi:MAG: hypothetical protein ACRD2N_08120 [Vicinamibacterales bacterium]
MRRCLALSWVMLALAPTLAAAQAMEGAEVPERAGGTAADYRFQIGPLGLTPTLVIQNLGVDTNATLSAEDPVRDFTFRATPGTRYLLPIRRLRLSGTSTVSFQYWEKTKSQRSIDVLNQAELTLAGNRVQPRVFGRYGRQRARPNLEIEATVAQLAQGLGVGADLRFSPRFVIQLEAEESREDFEDQLFRGASLSQQLNRTSQTVRTNARVALTPITTLVLTGVNVRERFQSSPLRDAESLTLHGGFETKPSALIAGKVMVGYRRFNALSASVPDYRGLVADIAASYTLFDRTRFGISGRRNLEFSAETDSPYYVGTGGGVLITQMLGHGWDIQVGADRDRLAYRTFSAPATSVPSGRTEHVESLRGGFGFHVGDTARIGVEVAHAVRRSPVKALSYEGWRAGVKITYGA